MANIANSGGVAGNNSGSVASLALASYTSHSGQDIFFLIVLGSIAVSVNSISASAGTYGTFSLVVAQNGTGVRTELWKVHVTTGAATVFTINLSGSTSIAAALEEYSSVVSTGHTASASGSNSSIESGTVLLQEGNNFIVGGMGFACQSGDTVAVGIGFSKHTSIPAATAVGVNSMDNTSVIVATIETMATISTARQWAGVGVELRSSSSAIGSVDYAAATAAVLQENLLVSNLTDFAVLNITMPEASTPSVGGSSAPLWGTFNISNGTVALFYSFEWYLERCGTPVTYTLQSGTLPPGLTLSSVGAGEGQLAGTPTTAGVYTFTIRATNSFGYEDKAFSVTISAASAGGAVYTFSQG